MKSLTHTLVVLFALSIAIPLNAQSFEGTITYAQDYELSGMFKQMGVTKEMLLEKLKEEEDWFDQITVTYKKGNYKFVAQNKTVLTKIYDPATNTIYSYSEKGEDICAVKVAVDLTLDGKPDKPEVIELDSAVSIMGFPCKIIRMKWSLGQVDYYYNPSQAKVDPALFSKHTEEGFAEFVKRSGCLPLQIVRGAMGMNVIHTATAINPGNVNQDIFKIPVLKDDKDLSQMNMVPGTKYMRIKKS